MEILLFIGPDEEANVAAVGALERSAAVTVRVVRDTKSLEGRVLLPFIELPDGTRHYGLESIQKYAGVAVA